MNMFVEKTIFDKMGLHVSANILYECVLKFIYIASSYMHPRIFYSNMFFKENSIAVLSTMTIWVEALFKTG